MKTIKLYHHKTDGGAEYLTDKFIICPNGKKEGVFKNAKFIIRIDGDITKDAELSYNNYEKAYNILMDYWDSLPDEEKPKIDKQMKRLGL